MTTKNKPFEGVRVLELAGVMAGPATGMFLAELGADVIKVENIRTGGDVTRSWKLPGEKQNDDLSSYFNSVNRGKRSIALDLSSDEDRQVVYRLIKEADFVLASFKKGDGEKLGLTFEDCKQLNPSIIYGEITGFGRDSSRTAYDAIIQAESGFMYMNGTPESGPVKMPVALMDLLAAHQLKEGLLVAWIHKLKTGEGGYHSVSLYQAAVASLANQASNFLKTGNIPQPIGSGHPNIVPYGTVFYDKNKLPLVLAVGNDRQFKALCSVLNAAGLSSDKRFATNPDRVIHREALEKLLQEKISTFERSTLQAALENNKVPAGAVKNMQEVFETKEVGALLFPDQTVKGVRSFVCSGFSETEPGRPPHLSEHAAEVRKNGWG